MSTRFRMMYSPLSRNPNKPRHQSRWHSHSSQPKLKRRPPLLAIVPECLCWNSGSEEPLAIRDMRRSLTAGDGLANQIIGENFVPDLINGCSAFLGELETWVRAKKTAPAMHLLELQGIGGTFNNVALIRDY